VKPKLLIIELWGVGDLIIASPFLRKAGEEFDVTLLAKPFAFDLQPRFWPNVKVVPFNAPWTAFNRKYHLWSWPWRKMFSVWLRLHREKFDVVLSARWDPRDHFLLRLTGAKARLGFPRTGSQFFLTHALAVPNPLGHRYENWRILAQSMKLHLEPWDKIHFAARRRSRVILIHTGAAQPVRVWPLERYNQIVKRLRTRGHQVRIVCNPEQLAWWHTAGEKEALAPCNISELMDIMDECGVFIGNDSGPGHLAGFCGLPTFTFFGPQLPEWFLPLHPAAEFMEGKPCPYKPCSDYCRFPVPHCLWNTSEAEAWSRIETFLNRTLSSSRSADVSRAAVLT
jgi:ADP-heptose:LPS heptosyltransferase